MSKILQKSNTLVQQEQKEGNEHRAIIHKQFDEILLRLQEGVNKANQLEQEIQQIKDYYEAIINEIEKKISGILIK